MGKWEPEKTPAPLIFDPGSFFVAVPRGCLWPPQTHSGGCSVLLEAEEWVNGPLRTPNSQKPSQLDVT
jgi:hypothetical protein